ncbi:class F sortase [uncultured Pseudokineococcus sp.]|uniref:class F sortase n=1 Tax=uncultured Pseudokineococcus sp. TaxID=1642928 RepID=UPI00262D32A3|nr:class F sortase [uncultured Pseudokineococcus sp.]
MALLACLAVAVGTPLAWTASRPPAAVGDGVSAALADPAPDLDAAPATPAPEAAGEDAQRAPAAVPAIPAAAARDASPSAVDTRRAPAASPPVEVRVPAIGAVAPVDAMGVDADGAMGLPDDVARTSWYRWGAAPGSGAGSAVIAGHVASATDGRGVLADLPELGLGDAVEVVTADGSVLEYRVVTREAVVKEALPVAELFDDAGPERLVLVTCGGPYLRDVGAHRDNVVVVAEPL